MTRDEVLNEFLSLRDRCQHIAKDCAMSAITGPANRREQAELDAKIWHAKFEVWDEAHKLATRMPIPAPKPATIK
jgi:hypothetical protein